MTRESQNFLRASLNKLGLPVAAELENQLNWYVTELLRWNRKINLTAIKDPEEALEKHVLDSLTLVPYLPPRGPLLDMGSGAGLPGLPVKMACPFLDVCSVDSVGKKIVFQQHVARTLGLKGFSAVAARIEELAQRADYRRRFMAVTARALTPLSGLIEMAHPFLIKDGCLLAMKGPDADAELAGSGQALDRFAMRVEAVHRLRLPCSGAERNIVVLRWCGKS